MWLDFNSLLQYRAASRECSSAVAQELENWLAELISPLIPRPQIFLRKLDVLGGYLGGTFATRFFLREISALDVKAVDIFIPRGATIPLQNHLIYDQGALDPTPEDMVVLDEEGDVLMNDDRVAMILHARDTRHFITLLLPGGVVNMHTSIDHEALAPLAHLWGSHLITFVGLRHFGSSSPSLLLRRRGLVGRLNDRRELEEAAAAARSGWDLRLNARQWDVQKVELEQRQELSGLIQRVTVQQSSEDTAGGSRTLRFEGWNGAGQGGMQRIEIEQQVCESGDRQKMRVEQRHNGADVWQTVEGWYADREGKERPDSRGKMFSGRDISQKVMAEADSGRRTAGYTSPEIASSDPRTHTTPVLPGSAPLQTPAPRYRQSLSYEPPDAEAGPELSAADAGRDTIATLQSSHSPESKHYLPDMFPPPVRDSWSKREEVTERKAAMIWCYQREDDVPVKVEDAGCPPGFGDPVRSGQRVTDQHDGHRVDVTAPQADDTVGQCEVTSAADGVGQNDSDHPLASMRADATRPRAGDTAGLCDVSVGDGGAQNEGDQLPQSPRVDGSQTHARKGARRREPPDIVGDDPRPRKKLAVERVVRFDDEVEIAICAPVSLEDGKAGAVIEGNTRHLKRKRGSSTEEYGVTSATLFPSPCLRVSDVQSTLPMAILTFSSTADLPEVPLIPGDYGAQGVLQVKGRNATHGFWVPLEREPDKRGQWDRMVAGVAQGGLLDFDVSMAQNHVIGGLFVGYRELSKAVPGRAGLYAQFTRKLRDICSDVDENEDAEPRLREVVEWLHEILPEDIFLAIPGYWKGEVPTPVGPQAGESTTDWIRHLPIEGEALTWCLRLEKASRILPTVEGGDHLADQLANMQAELLARGVSRQRHPIEDMRAMLGWVKGQVPEDVYANIMNA
ncbi:hypothetical protein K466DRAFT_602237 [Polyporus arcularius HHB13444]|uniref:Uncharacterized protein n=1 Tax=Polyporus arcularius HHB13444 TaxID=1314778 RepID=A0A5C3P573_9APHY|nr:hypothetical protein K466DRAFT_602237 [Polyporus arcularius HHB13444]